MLSMQMLFWVCLQAVTLFCSACLAAGPACPFANHLNRRSIVDSPDAPAVLPATNPLVDPAAAAAAAAAPAAPAPPAIPPASTASTAPTLPAVSTSLAASTPLVALSFSIASPTTAAALPPPVAPTSPAPPPAIPANVPAANAPPVHVIRECARKSNVAGGGTRNRDFWPCQVRLDVLRQFSAEANPMGKDFDYVSAFKQLDYKGIKDDLTKLMTDSQDWWPADYGHYGSLFIRMAWHSAGTYRAADGRGGGGMGQERFAPLGSWPDNQNLDKARRLLWPIKDKYGSKISWADLMILTGNVALESMGFKTLGFGGGRPDVWQSDEAVYWGAETQFVPQGNDVRYNSSNDVVARSPNLEKPLGATHMGLIYVNPEGPNANGDPIALGSDIKVAFDRMGFSPDEAVALIAGGHTFGKTHGAGAGSFIGPEPEAAPLEMVGLGWANNFQSGKANDAITSGLEVIWTETPTKWGPGYFKSLFGNKWVPNVSPGGGKQFIAQDSPEIFPDPFNATKKLKPTMMVADLALLQDPDLTKISRRYFENQSEFENQFAQAWFKLTHHDMGPLARYLGPEVPKQQFPWQDPLPPQSGNMKPLSDSDIMDLKNALITTPGLDTSKLVTTAWAAASTFRFSDKRGGANGARIALDPQLSWAVNNPPQLKGVLDAIKTVQTRFNDANRDGKQISLADTIVLGGIAAVEKAGKDGGCNVKIPFTPGRVDALQEQTDITIQNFLEPKVDGFRNFGTSNERATTEELLIDKANQLSLSPPEMVVLIGGMRALNANADGSANGILTSRPGVLSNDYFRNLLDINNVWSSDDGEIYKGVDRKTGQQKFTATRADLVLASHPELRAIAEVYGSSDGEAKFTADFANAWNKVMMLDRFDLLNKV